MCHRVSPLLFEELEQALKDLKETGRARVPTRNPKTRVPDAYPGRPMPLFVPNEEGNLQVTELIWGFKTTIKGSQKLVFNTRMDTALRQGASGDGLWANPIVHGRCLVPVRAFYESWTKSAERRRSDVRFTMPGRQVFLLAGVQEGGCFSIMTTNPNADVGAYHTRMPLVLAPGESTTWLGPRYASLAYRSKIRLDAEPEL